MERYIEGLQWPFLACLSIMVLAHVSNSVIFWMTLPAADHPLRLAYFLPLIHLSRLLKVTWRTCTCNGLKDFRDSQELSSLYNILAASLETAPQIMLQFYIVFPLQAVPTTLIVSLVASLLSVIYNGSMAILSLVQKSGMSFPWKAFIPLITGFHTFAAIVARTMLVASLAPRGAYVYTPTPIIIYFCVGTIGTWLSTGFLMHKSYYNSFSQSSHKWINQMRHAVHSFALAHVSFLIGPMYVIVRLFDEPYLFLLLGTLLHIFIEILGLILVLITGRVYPNSGIPLLINDVPNYSNKYQGWSMFLTILCPSLVVLLLSVVLFNVVSKRGRHEVFISEGDHHEAEMADAKFMISDNLEEKVERELAILPSYRQPTTSVAS
eukprot:c17913_g1_i3 orf=251-1387(-)